MYIIQLNTGEKFTVVVCH